ncbi:hypothetical protein P7K49_031006 [Saguinus oedipus]|uniref:Uncharacterized protein n=1 Tax=Saguinus oedipus TaxID=9490 RepID=A0ABQ9U3S5_SAGOE|nr:hypothetical protein P7K49_031006 [Saguinus oedipus]
MYTAEEENGQECILKRETTLKIQIEIQERALKDEREKALGKVKLILEEIFHWSKNHTFGINGTLETFN